jgi:hypothetical protein
MKPTLNEQLARMQKLAGIITENQTNERYDEFQRADKGSKGVTAKNKSEEEVYGAGVEKGEKIEKKRMTKKQLRAEIKEMILAELNEDSTEDVNEPGALNNLYSPLGEAEDDMQNLKFNWLIKDEDFYKYDEKGVADGLEVRDGKKVKEIVGYFEDEDGDEDFDVIAYISSDGDIVDSKDNEDALYDFWYKELDKKLVDLAKKGMKDSYKEEDEYKAKEDNDSKPLEIKDVDLGSIDVEGNIYDTGYISSAKFNNGEELSLDQRIELEDLLGKDKIAKLTNLNEAKKDEEVEDVTVDDTEVVDAPEADMMAGETAEVSGIQSNLQAAYAEAKALGDEKLITQIANTITYFTKAHILDTAPVNEAINDDSADAIYNILSNMDNEDIINDMFTAMQKNPEMKLEDFLNQYDAGDNPDDDNDDNYDDNMDVYDDSYPDMAEAKKAKGKLDQINENMFPMLKRILR